VTSRPAKRRSGVCAPSAENRPCFRVEIEWRDAARRDRPPLQRFQCTDDAPKRPEGRALPHPKQWEVDVQGWIRTRTPPAGPNEVLRLGVGHAETEISAVGGACVIATDGPIAVVKLIGIAIAARYRNTGGELADQTMEQMLRCAKDLVQGVGSGSWIAADSKFETCSPAISRTGSSKSHRFLSQTGGSVIQAPSGSGRRWSRRSETNEPETPCHSKWHEPEFCRFPQAVDRGDNRRLPGGTEGIKTRP
jgi:hypothetical protein